MRRSRISIKPNVRPGGRSVAPTEASTGSQEPTAVHNTQQAQIGEEIDRPSTAPKSRLEVIEPAVATEDRNVPSSPSEKASVNTSDGVPSSVSLPATTALQRRSRISATPNLARPKIHSVVPLSTGKTASLPSVPSKSLPEASVPVSTSRDDSPNTTFSDPINSQTTATAHCSPSSPSLPSTSGFHEPSIRTKSVPESPFTQSQQETPKQIKTKNSVPQEGATPVLPYVKLARFDGPGSPLKNSEMTSDKQRVLKALKLKELMKLERRKERMVGKKRQKHEHSDEVDLTKMTIADFIYYLPQSNPLRSSLSTEELQEKTIVPPSPKVLEKMAETDEEDDYAEEEMLVPKVKVAEDGSLILDDNSLTVRVQRTSDTVVENAKPLFEQGNSTTYSSFRKKCCVKNWSVRETDMFYLAISMVGTDFSLIAQLLPHRSRAEIKRKFRREDKTNSWRVDQAFRKKRPYDQEFFSFLLKRVLAKDKERGQSIKLVIKKEKKGKGRNKDKDLEDEDIIDDNNGDDDLYFEESGSLDLEKENEDSSNVKVADAPLKTSKKRKRTREPEVSLCGKTRKPRKNNKKSKKGECLVEESELLNVGDDILEGDSVNAENKDTPCTSIPAKKRKRSKKGDKKRQEEEPQDKCKTKKKKALKVPTDVDREPTQDDGEGDEISEEHTSDVSIKKRKRCKKLKEKHEPTKGKLKTKKTKMSNEDSVEVELVAKSSEVSTACPGGEEDQGEKLIQKTAAQVEIPHNSSKILKKPNLATRKSKKCSEATMEVEDTTQETQDENCKEAEIEYRIGSLADKPLHKQAVVVLERTPPRLKNAESSSQGKDQPHSPQNLQASPERQKRAEKVKRNLNASESKIKEKGKMDEHQDGSGSDTSPEEMSNTAMHYQVAIQKCEEMEADHSRTLLKKLVVLVSHEEVEHYLRVQSQPDATSAKVDSVEEQADGPEEKGSSSVTLKERDSQDRKEKDSDSASVQDPEEKDSDSASVQDPEEKDSECASVQDPEEKDSDSASVQDPEEKDSECASVQDPEEKDSDSASVQDPEKDSECASVQDPEEKDSECASVQDPEEKDSDSASVQDPEEKDSECASVQDPEEKDSECASVQDPEEKDSDSASVQDPEEKDSDSASVQDPEEKDSDSASVQEPEEKDSECASVQDPEEKDSDSASVQDPEEKDSDSASVQDPEEKDSECASVQDPEEKDSDSASVQDPEEKDSECASVQDPEEKDSDSASVQDPEKDSECASVQDPEEKDSECASVQDPEEKDSDSASVQDPEEKDSECASVQDPEEKDSECASVQDPEEKDSDSASVQDPEEKDSDSASVQDPEEKDSDSASVQEPEEKDSECASVQDPEEKDSDSASVQDPEEKDSECASVQDPEEKDSDSASVQDPEEKDSDSASVSDQQCNAQNKNPPSSKYDSSQQQCSSSVEDKVKTAPNEDLVEQHRESPEEKYSITQEVNRFQDVKDNTSTDLFPSFPSDEETSPWVSKKFQEILSFLDEPQVPPTTPSDKDANEKETKPGSFLTSENKDQITDQEESKSERNESELEETLTEEPQKELKRTIPTSCSEQSADDASVTTQQYIAPERRSWFSKPKPNLRRASKVMINPQQAIKPNKGSTSETGCQNPAKAQHCDLDLNIKTVSREDELVSSDVNLQEHDEHLLSSVPSFNPTKTLGPKVPVDNSGTGNEEQIDNQTNKEPTFILTLYEIPASQLLLEATSGPQDTDLYELEPAKVQTPLCSGNSLSLPSTLEASCCTVPQMRSEEIEKPYKSVSQKGEHDSLIPVAANAAKDDITQSQESSSPLESQEVLTSNDAMKPTDITNVLKLEPRPTESTAAKPPPQRRSKIKVRPILRPCVKFGPSNTNQSYCESSQPTTSKVNIPTSHQEVAQQPKMMESNQKTSDNLHGGNEGVLLNATVPDSEEGRDKIHWKKESPPKTGLQMGEESIVGSSVSPSPFSAEADHVVDTEKIPGQHSTVIKDVEDSCVGVSHIVLDDSLVLAFGEMEDADDDMGMAGFHERKLQKFEDISVCLPESKRLLSADDDQTEEVTDISKKVDTCGEASAVTPSVTQEIKMPFRRSKLQVKPKLAKAKSHNKDGSSRKEQSKIELIHPATSPIISPVPQQVIEPQIKEMTDKVEQRSEQDDLCDMVPTVTNEVVKVKQLLIPLTSAKTSICAESPPVEKKSEDWHKDVPHTVLPDIFVPVSEDEVHKESGIPLQCSFQSSEDPYICAVESQQTLIAEEDEEMGEGVSHKVLTDIFIPVSEEIGDDLTKEWTTTGRRSPHKAERSQLKKHPDISNLLCAESSNLSSSNSPRRNTPMRKGKLKVKMKFPKTKESSKSVQQSLTSLSVPTTSMVKQQGINLTLNSLETEHVSQSKVETNSEDGKSSTKDLTPFAGKDLQPWQQSTHCSVKETLTCPDPEKTFEGVSHTAFYDVIDETAESCLHKEGFLVGLQDRKEKPSQDVVKVIKPTDIERPSNTEREESTASRSVSVERKAPSCRGATPQHSLEPQAEEWSLKSDMLPMDSDEIDNWCEGVSHMLLSDAFVPVSEIEEENSSEKACVARSPKKDKEYALSPSETKETSSEKTNEVHQSGSVSQMPKIVINSSERLLASQAINSPGRGAFHMTLRSPQRTYPKDRPDLLKSTQAVPTTPQLANASDLRESVRTPTKQQTEEITNVCRVQLEKLSSDEICLRQNYLQPRHHSTPVNVKTTSRGSVEIHKASLPLHGSTSTVLASCADEEPPMPSGNWPKVVLSRIEIKATDADISIPTASPARVSTTASQKLSEHQSPHSSPLNSGLEGEEEPGQVSQFFLDDIFTEVDPD
ncbi:transcription factor TFIIIB component B'' homolog [Xyrauchen texanus]|uniref:transcription factor TFIIIB component B'' homolog n=1 Tax=Xyrauchen texanus TaxID=154827 RepID=UPI002241B4C1|nr:transcription factor TFIIIB component B'' homolog [Xyrauchen texanus]